MVGADGKPLGELYWELQLEEYLPLRDFCRRARAGEFGPRPPAEIEAFLREVETAILQNIHLKIEEAPHLAADRDERVEETQEQIAALIREFARG